MMKLGGNLIIKVMGGDGRKCEKEWKMEMNKRNGLRIRRRRRSIEIEIEGKDEGEREKRKEKLKVKIRMGKKMREILKKGLGKWWEIMKGREGEVGNEKVKKKMRNMEDEERKKSGGKELGLEEDKEIRIKVIEKMIEWRLKVERWILMNEKRK